MRTVRSGLCERPGTCFFGLPQRAAVLDRAFGRARLAAASPANADAILERLVHDAHRIDISGAAYAGSDRDHRKGV